MQNKITYFGCLFLILLASCNNVQPLEESYGIKYNDEREKIGLLPLNSQWQSKSRWSPPRDAERDSVLIVMWNPENLDSIENTGKSFYTEKSLTFKKDTLIGEADGFTGPDSFRGKGKFACLLYVYYFMPYEMHSAGWEYEFIWQIDEDEFGKGICDHKYLTRNEADSILNSWGLKYQ